MLPLILVKIFIQVFDIGYILSFISGTQSGY